MLSTECVITFDLTTFFFPISNDKSVFQGTDGIRYLSLEHSQIVLVKTTYIIVKSVKIYN